jgi:uncharacterized protein YndB with AHSA1/START domain
MSERSTEHATFVIERSYPQSRARVFAAWANPAAKARWFSGPAEWHNEGLELDFRVGGRERLRVEPPSGVAHTFDCTYQDIVVDERIVYTYDMHLGEAKISVSLATVEFKPEGFGTRMIFTEQAVFLDGYDDVGKRERGTKDLLEKLAGALASSSGP